MTHGTSNYDHAAFIADYGLNRLEHELIQTGEKWLKEQFDAEFSMELSNRFISPTRKLKANPNKALSYIARLENKGGRPHLHLLILDRRDKKKVKFDGYAEVFEPAYKDWLELKRALTEAEKEAWAARAADRQAQAARDEQEYLARQEQAQLEAVEREEQAEANRAADHEVWAELPEQGSSAYLRRKGLPHVTPARYEGDKLVLPMWSATGTFGGVERLLGNGDKIFTTGGRMKAHLTVLGGQPEREGRLDLHDLPRFIAEGVATAVRPQLAYGEPVIVAYNAGNLIEVVRAICAALDETGMQAEKDAWLERLVILADNDIWKAEQVHNGVKLGNVGLKAACAAARAFGCRIALPDFTGLPLESEPTDFDDQARLAEAAGQDWQAVVRAQIDAAQYVTPPEEPDPSGGNEPDQEPEELPKAAVWDSPEAQEAYERLPGAQDPEDFQDYLDRVYEEGQERKDAYLAYKLEHAIEQQSASQVCGEKTDGHEAEGYLTRKGVTTVLETHATANVTTAEDKMLPGLAYGLNYFGGKHAPVGFTQFAVGDVDGTLRGFYRAYNAPCLKGPEGRRDEDYIGQIGGGSVLLLPHGLERPTPKALPGLLRKGYKIGLCTSVATGMSVCAANPKTIMFCALSSANLGYVAGAIRRHYGTLKKVGSVKVAINITIWADTDPQEGQNPALEAAHHAALVWHCAIRVPSPIRGKSKGAKPTTFNDVHIMSGLDTIKKARNAKLDTRIALARDLAAQTLSPDKHIAPFELPGVNEALVVQAVHGSGKTFQLERVVRAALAAGKRVLVIVHRRQLALTLSARLGLINYEGLSPDDLRAVTTGLVICFDSLYKLKLGGELPHFDLLVLDECEQVLRHTIEPHIRYKIENFDTLTHYLGRTSHFIGMDADAGEATQNALARHAPSKVVRWVRHEYHLGKEGQVRMPYHSHDLLDAFEACNEPSRFNSLSLRRVRDLGAYYGDEDTLILSSETTSSEVAQAYLADPKGQAKNWQKVFHTSSAQSGLDDSSGHVQEFFGDYSGELGTSEDIIQGMQRSRGTPKHTIYVKPTKRPVKSHEDFLREIEAAEREEVSLGGRPMERHEGYLQHKVLGLEQKSKARADIKTAVARGLTLLGYSVQIEMPRNLGKAELKRAADRDQAIREDGLKKYIADRLKVERIDEHTALLYEEDHRLTPDQQMSLEVYKFIEAYTPGETMTDDELADKLEQDNYGRLRDELKHFDAMFMPRAEAVRLAHKGAETRALGDGKTPVQFWERQQVLAKLIGIDQETDALIDAWCVRRDNLDTQIDDLTEEREGATKQRKGKIKEELKTLNRERDDLMRETLPTRYGADQVAKTLGAWDDAHRDSLAPTLGKLPTHDQLHGTHAVAHAATALRRAGLKHLDDGSKNNKTYAVLVFSIERMRNFSLPRRKIWAFAQNLENNKDNNKSLRKTPETPSWTNEVSYADEAKTSSVRSPVKLREEARRKRLSALTDLIKGRSQEVQDEILTGLKCTLVSGRPEEKATVEELLQEAADFEMMLLPPASPTPSPLAVI